MRRPHHGPATPAAHIRFSAIEVAAHSTFRPCPTDRAIFSRVAGGNLTLRLPQTSVYTAPVMLIARRMTHFQCAYMRGYRPVISRSLRWALFDPCSRLYLQRIQRTR